MIKEITKEEASGLPVYKGNKVVNVVPSRIKCYAPLYGPIEAPLKGVIFSTGDILYVLGREAEVHEVLKDGTKVKLTLDNYDRWIEAGDVPGPGYIPEIPEQKEEEEVEEPGEGDGKEPETPVTPPEETEDKSRKSKEDEVDILDEMPDGLSTEEQEEWLNEQLSK